MLDDIMRFLEGVFDNELVQHLGKHALLEAIKEMGHHVWHWAQDHWPDIWDAVTGWFS